MEVEEEIGGCKSVEIKRCFLHQIRSLEPGTHAYSFWEGVPTEGKCAFGKLFAESKSMKVPSSAGFDEFLTCARTNNLKDVRKHYDISCCLVSPEFVIAL